MFNVPWPFTLCGFSGHAQAYSPTSNDLWGAAVILFIMVVGAPPFELPSASDQRFNAIIEGNLKFLVNHWGIFHLSPELLDLMQGMLRPQAQRLSMQAVLAHPWLMSGTPTSTAMHTVPTASASAASAVAALALPAVVASPPAKRDSVFSPVATCGVADVMDEQEHAPMVPAGARVPDDAEHAVLPRRSHTARTLQLPMAPVLVLPQPPAPVPAPQFHPAVEPVRVDLMDVTPRTGGFEAGFAAQRAPRVSAFAAQRTTVNIHPRFPAATAVAPRAGGAAANAWLATQR